MTAALKLSKVSWVRDGRTILVLLDTRVRDGERWLVLGAHRPGTTTSLRIPGLHDQPTTDTDLVPRQRPVPR